MKLTIKDLKQVRGLLYKVRDKWHDIGIELEIDVDELNIIRKNHDNHADGLVEVLQLWLKSVEPHPTWKILADALRADAIKEADLAAKADLKEISSSADVDETQNEVEGISKETEQASFGEDPEAEKTETGNTENETGNTENAEPSTSSKPRQYLCLIEPGSDGGVTFVSTETGKKFLHSSEFIEYNDHKSPKNYDGKSMGEVIGLPSFHGVIDGYEAERRLREQDSDCCFLTRYSETRDELTLSVLRRNDIFKNFAIIGEPQECPTKYEITESEEKFDHIADLLEFYKSHKLNQCISSIGDELKNRHDKTDHEPEEESGHSLIYKKTISKVENAVPQWALNAMDDHPSFHGSMTRIEAVKKLIESGKSSYLTRYSGYKNRYCVLSMLQMSDDGELLQHLKLEVPRDKSDEPKYRVAETDVNHDTISELLEHYQKRPLKQVNHLGECLEADKSIDMATELTETGENEEDTVEMSRPTKANLRCITYQDEEGDTHDFKLIEKVSDRWITAGMRLQFSKNRLDKYRDKSEDDVKRCKYVFSKWIKNHGHQEYPLTWVGLRTLLIDMGRRTVADKLYTVLETKNDNVVY